MGLNDNPQSLMTKWQMTINDNHDSFSLSNILNICYLYLLLQLYIVVVRLPKRLFLPLFNTSEEPFYPVCRDKPSKKPRKNLKKWGTSDALFALNSHKNASIWQKKCDIYRLSKKIILVTLEREMGVRAQHPMLNYPTGNKVTS